MFNKAIEYIAPLLAKETTSSWNQPKKKNSHLSENIFLLSGYHTFTRRGKYLPLNTIDS